LIQARHPFDRSRELGAARAKARAAWRLVDVEVAPHGGAFSFTLNRSKLRQTRWREERNRATLIRLAHLASGSMPAARSAASTQGGDVRELLEFLELLDRRCVWEMRKRPWPGAAGSHHQAAMTTSGSAAC
jgi:hypothetical protein